MRDPITSTTNPRVKHLVKLRDRRARDETGTFVIEGYRAVRRALDAGIRLDEVYSCEELFLGDNEAALVERSTASGARHVRLAEAPFRKAAYRDRPEGLLAVAPHLPTALESLSIPADPLILVVEAIEKPGNLGTMLRTADGAGVAAVIVTDPTTDPFNPNVVRASTGSLFTVPLAVTSSDEARALFDAQGIRTIATTPDTEQPHWSVDYRGPVAIVVGSEQFGLSQQWLTEATEQVRIPMAGPADSLNAAMAAGVVLFEAVRQRA